MLNCAGVKKRYNGECRNNNKRHNKYRRHRKNRRHNYDKFNFGTTVDLEYDN